MYHIGIILHAYKLYFPIESIDYRSIYIMMHLIFPLSLLQE